MTNLLSTAQAAAILGIRRRTVSALITRGILTGQKLGRDWMLTLEEVKRYQTERRPRGWRPGRPRKETQG